MSNLTKSHQPKSSQWQDLARHYLGDIIYGASDGIVTTFVIVSSVTAAKLSTFIILVLGLANLIADGVSMGGSRYLSIRAKSEAYGHNRGYLEPALHALVTFIAFVSIGATPLVAFLIPGLVQHGFYASCVSTGLALFIIGASHAHLGDGRWLKSGIEMFLVGTVAASVAYFIGSYIGSISECMV